MKLVGYLIGQFPAVNHYYLALEIHYLREAGFDIKVASIAPSDRPFDQLRPKEQSLAPGVYVVKAESKLVALGAAAREFIGNPFRFLSALKRARSLAKSNGRPGIYGIYYLVEAVLVGRWMKRNQIPHLYASFTANIAVLVGELFGYSISFGVYGFGELYDPVGNQLGLKIARSVFVRSVSKHGVGQLMLACPTEDWPKLRYIALGIEPDAFPPRRLARSDRFEMICVGRLSPEKGHRLLLAAVEILVKKGRTVTMRFIGDGPDRAHLEADAKRRVIDAHVVFEGRVDQQRLDEVYGMASVFVMASLYEGIPIVLMEAMSREIPCIAPAINGIPELLVHGETGLLFNPGDAEELTALIVRLMDSPSEAERLGKAGRKRVLDQYDITKNTPVLGEAFRAI